MIRSLEPLLLTEVDESALLRDVLERMGGFPGIDAVWYGYMDGEGGTRPALVRDNGLDSSPPMPGFNGELAITSDWSTDPDAQLWRESGPGWSSSVILPLPNDSGPQGIVALYSRDTGRFSSRDQAEWAHFARLLGLALQRCRGRASEQAYARLLDAIVRTHESFDPDADEAAIADSFVGILHDSSLFPIVWVGRQQPGGELEVLASRGVSADIKAAYLEAHRAAQAAGAPLLFDQVMESGESRWREDYQQEAILDNPVMQGWREQVDVSGLRLVAMSPIPLGGDVWGVLTANSFARVVDFERLLPVLERGARTLGLAIERRSRERELRDALAELDLESRAIAAAQQGISIADMRQPEQPLIFVNPAFTRITGYAPADVLGCNCRVLQDETTDPAARNQLRDAIEARQPVTVVLQNRRKDGGHFWNEVSLSPVIAEDGQLTHYIGLQTDVTDRVHEEIYRRQMATVVENMQEGVVFTDADLHILSVNEAFTRITGYTRDEVIGEKPAILRSDRHDNQFYEQREAILRERGFWQGEVWNRDSDGVTYPAMLSISAVHDAKGEVRHYVGVFTDISTLKEREQALQQAATRDFLTGLPNRYALDQRMETCLPRAIKQQTLLAIGLLDLDGFKGVNDTYGHETGDQLLTLLAERLRKTLRSSDFLARLGGDEFVLLMEDIRRWSDVEILLERLGAVFDENFLVGDLELRLGASLGLTLYPIDEARPRDLLRHADHALYVAKGHDRKPGLSHALYAYNPAEHESAASAPGTSEPTFARARELVPQNIEVYYQPVFDLPAQKMCEVEALARLRYLDGTWGADDFLDKLPPMDVRRTSFVVLDQALAQARRWAADGMELGVSVNFEPLDLLAPGTALAIESRLEAHRIDPAKLTLEIVDSGRILTNPVMAEHLLALKKLGIGLALDDLGSTYASLERLRSLPFDTLKLDRAFGMRLDRSPVDLRFLLSLVDLAQSLAVDLVVEGVDSAETLAAVQALGVTRVQGYLLAPPLTGGQVLRHVVTTPVAQQDAPLPAYARHLIWARGVRSRLLDTASGALDAGESPLHQAALRFPGLSGMLERYTSILHDTVAGQLTREVAVLLIDTVEREIMQLLDARYRQPADGD
ncbi:bifunctional diguanylate cyclase/phosphodiesterase [Acidihalobacter aeolianus]|uniref:bifunctional diguanylate cyclase/phosphodiesterase n=1 Tax=Acidihalobacter aeolianus TaxID=2792603 RepID=UPI000B198259|nr:EAL domain-containing protein [Acidihalobacter aeolianus]